MSSWLVPRGNLCPWRLSREAEGHRDLSLQAELGGGTEEGGQEISQRDEGHLGGQVV